jgi:ATP-binding cassette subfamily B protein
MDIGGQSSFVVDGDQSKGISDLKEAFVGALRLTWRASRPGTVTLGAIAMVEGLFPPAVVLLGKHLVDLVATRARPGPDISDVTLTVLGLGLVIAGQRVLGSIQASQQDVFAVRVQNAAEAAFNDHAATIDLARFDDSSWHDRMARARREVSWRPWNLTYTLIGLGSATVTFVGMLLVLVSIHPILALLAILSVAPGLVLQRANNRRLYHFWMESTPEWRMREYMQTILTEPAWTKEVRAFDLRHSLMARYTSIAREQLNTLTSLHRTGNVYAVIGGVAGGAVLGGAYAFMAWRGLSGGLTPGDLTAAIGAIASVAGQIGVISGSLLNLDQHARFLRDYFWFLDTMPTVVAPPLVRSIPQHLSQGIVLENVSFRYPATGEPALDRVSLTLKPGELMALVGENGAGKTSIVKLLLRFYDPDSGRVLFDGTDIRDFDPAELRARIGVLFQDYGSYNLTVRENVAFGRVDREPSDASIEQALKAARASSIGLAGGLDSYVGRLFEGGHDLSGGEWQRLALARLMYRDAQVWILDEPTAALDPAAEAEIFAELREVLRGRSGVIISHRFSTVRVADHIVVLARGRVVEEGTHDELLARGGHYARLFEFQAAGYR